MSRDFTRSANRDFFRSPNRDRGAPPRALRLVTLELFKYGFFEFGFGIVGGIHPSPTLMLSDRYRTLRIRCSRVTPTAGEVEEKLTFHGEHENPVVPDFSPLSKTYLNYTLVSWTFPSPVPVIGATSAFNTTGWTVGDRTKDHIRLTRSTETIDIWLEDKVEGITELESSHLIGQETGLTTPNVPVNGSPAPWEIYRVDRYRRFGPTTTGQSFYDMAPILFPCYLGQTISYGPQIWLRGYSGIRYGGHSTYIYKAFVGSRQVYAWTVRSAANLSIVSDPLEEFACESVQTSGFLDSPSPSLYPDRMLPAAMHTHRWGFPVHTAPERSQGNTIKPSCFPQAYP
jgi:hypothetical protein